MFANLNHLPNPIEKIKNIRKNNGQSNLYAKVRSTTCKKKATNYLERAPQMKCKEDSKQYQKYQILSKAIIVVFDAKFYLLAVDNHSSCCMSNNINDFVGPLVDKRVRMKGVQGASVYSKVIGTVKWKIEDDNGIIHDRYIKDTLYVPESMQRLLSPQQWVQQSQDVYPKTCGTFAIQDKDVIELHWDLDEFKKTIIWDKSTNTAFIRSVPGYRTFFQFSKHLKQSLSAQHQCCQECTHVCNSVHMHHDDYQIDQSISFDEDKTLNLRSTHLDHDPKVSY